MGTRNNYTFRVPQPHWQNEKPWEEWNEHHPMWCRNSSILPAPKWTTGEVDQKLEVGTVGGAKTWALEQDEFPLYFSGQRTILSWKGEKSSLKEWSFQKFKSSWFYVAKQCKAAFWVGHVKYRIVRNMLHNAFKSQGFGIWSKNWFRLSSISIFG